MNAVTPDIIPDFKPFCSLLQQLQYGRRTIPDRAWSRCQFATISSQVQWRKDNGRVSIASYFSTFGLWAMSAPFFLVGKDGPCAQHHCAFKLVFKNNKRTVLIHSSEYLSPQYSQTVGTTGSTPLHFAAANGCLAIVEVLLRHGAIADLTDKASG